MLTASEKRSLEIFTTQNDFRRYGGDQLYFKVSDAEYFKILEQHNSRGVGSNKTANRTLNSLLTRELLEFNERAVDMTHEVATQIKTIGDNLREMLEKKASALPKNFNETRFLQNCLVVLSDTKDIEKCQPKDIARTLLKGAFLGLDFFNKECYPIIYGGQVQFQTDYKGEIKVSKRWSTNPIKDIYGKVVRKGDEFEAFVNEGRQVLNFKPLSFNDGEVIGAFAVVYFQDGSMLYDEMSKQAIEKTRQDYSKCPKSPAWIKSPDEMYKKTVIRRLCKLIDLDFDNDDQRQAFEDGGDIDKNKIKNTIDVTDVKDPFDKPKASDKDGGSSTTTNDDKLNPEEEARREKIRKEHPDYDEWQIDAIIKEEDESK